MSAYTLLDYTQKACDPIDLVRSWVILLYILRTIIIIPNKENRLRVLA